MLQLFNLKNMVFIFSSFLYILILYCWLCYDLSIFGYQFLFSIKYFDLYFYFGLDGLSFFFLYLTAFLIPLCMLLFYENNEYNVYYNIYSLLGLEILLLLVFLTIDFILFYIFFEIILIPFFLLIGIRSKRKRKIWAAYLLFFYTLLGSLAMLFVIVYLYFLYGTSNILLLNFTYKNIEDELLICGLLLFSFAIKVPMLPFHIWLPEAHVEAPTEGSVLLAGVILKIGVYGVLRFVFGICNMVIMDFEYIITFIASISIIYCSFSTLIQSDLKRIVAYSSIAHMNMCMLGIFSFNLEGLMGSLIVSIGHGFVSAGLFFLIGSLYKRGHSKLIKYYSGLIYQIPLLSIFFFIFILGNVSLPLTSNFIGELLILYSIYVNTNILSLIACIIGMFLCTVYSFLMFNKTVFGLPNHNTSQFINDLTLFEICIFIPIIFHVFWVGIYPLSWIDILIFSCNDLLLNLN
jgi:proton-translocating NADH-quinone oxidoreductase chain M